MLLSSRGLHVLLLLLLRNCRYTLQWLLLLLLFGLLYFHVGLLRHPIFLLSLDFLDRVLPSRPWLPKLLWDLCLVRRILLLLIEPILIDVSIWNRGRLERRMLIRVPQTHVVHIIHLFIGASWRISLLHIEQALPGKALLRVSLPLANTGRKHANLFDQSNLLLSVLSPLAYIIGRLPILESSQHLLVLNQNAVHFSAPYASVQREIGGGLVLLGWHEIGRIIILVELSCVRDLCIFALGPVSIVEKLRRASSIIIVVGGVNFFLLHAGGTI